MLNKAKTAHYLCPECLSPDIVYQIRFSQPSYWCNNQNCRTWGPWTGVKVVSVNKPLPPIIFTCRDHHPVPYFLAYRAS